jgi:ribosomal protein S18 acetylase RimI-like enzyme
MSARNQLRPKRSTDESFQIRELSEPNWVFNRDMYFAVGENWAWIDKRPWTDEQWKEYALAPELRTFAAYYNDTLAGYYELRRESELSASASRQTRRGEASLRPDGPKGGVEIAYFGLLPEFIGRGFGGALLTSAIEEAWRSAPPPSRVWVHTCNRDHPQALANYKARGMKVYREEVESLKNSEEARGKS